MRAYGANLAPYAARTSTRNAAARSGGGATESYGGHDIALVTASAWPMLAGRNYPLRKRSAAARPEMGAEAYEGLIHGTVNIPSHACGSID